jgi:DNA-binding CsgD family transcriptional regulator
LTLIERGRELERIDRVLAAVLDGSGGSLSFEGEAGIGKSELCHFASLRANEFGLTVLRAVGGELEYNLSFGVIRQLLGSRLEDGTVGQGGFQGDAALALRVLDLQAHQESDNEAAEFAINHGLFGLISALAQRTPLLLVVDDAQWADEASLRFLAFLIPRLGELGAGLVMAVRVGEQRNADILSVIRASAGLDVLTPRALSQEGVASFLGAYFASSLDSDFIEACWTFCAGNPLYIKWLADELTLTGTAPGRQAIAAIPNAVRGSISGRVTSRLANVNASSKAVLRALAVLKSGTDRSLLMELAKIEEPEFVEAISELVRLRVVNDSIELDFAHPLIRASVYEGMNLEQRSVLHRRAAELMVERGQRHEAAVHLLHTTPRSDPWVVNILLYAAERSGYVEAAAATVQLLRRAILEPPDPALRRKILVELGRAERLNSTDQAIVHLREAQQDTDEVEIIERVAKEMFFALAGVEDIHQRAKAIDEAITRIEETDPEAAIRLETFLIQDLLVSRTTFDWAVERMDDLLNRSIVDTPHLRCTRTIRLWIAYWMGEATAKDVVNAGIDAIASVPEDDYLEMAPLVAMVIYALQQCDCFEHQGTLSRLGLLTRDAGHTEALAQVMAVQSSSALIRGDARELEERSIGLLHLGVSSRSPWSILLGSQLVIHAALAAGDLSEADRRLTYYESQLNDPQMSDSPLLIEVRYLRALIRSAQGRHQEAVEDILAQLALDRTRSVPSLTIKSELTAAPILWAAGLHDLARELADQGMQIAFLRELPSQTGTAKVCVGMIRGGKSGIELIGEGCSLLKDTPRRLEYAQALLAYGSGLRRAGKRTMSQELLAEAMGLASSCGSRAVADRARQELNTTGIRTLGIGESNDVLTPAERRVAEMAALGLSNPEIAQELYLSRRTIEAHLRSIFRKLNISSRQEIEASLISAQEGPKGMRLP